jgi:hypothetical protein
MPPQLPVIGLRPAMTPTAMPATMSSISRNANTVVTIMSGSCRSR